MKALVVYGTRYGTATGIAQEISRVLEDEGIETDLNNAKEIKNFDINAYDLVVIGSGIKMGKWTKDSLNFLKRNSTKLKDKKVALFVTCGAANDPKTRAEGQEKYLDEVAGKYLINRPVSTGLYGSYYDPNAKHGLMYKITSKWIKDELKKQCKDVNEIHDYRNWDEIRKFARNLAQMVKG